MPLSSTRSPRRRPAGRTKPGLRADKFVQPLHADKTRFGTRAWWTKTSTSFVIARARASANQSLAATGALASSLRSYTVIDPANRDVG